MNEQVAKRSGAKKLSRHGPTKPLRPAPVAKTAAHEVRQVHWVAPPNILTIRLPRAIEYYDKIPARPAAGPGPSATSRLVHDIGQGRRPFARTWGARLAGQEVPREAARLRGAAPAPDAG